MSYVLGVLPGDSRSASLTSNLHFTMHTSRIELGPNFQALIIFLWSQADPSQNVEVKLFHRGTRSLYRRLCSAIRTHVIKNSPECSRCGCGMGRGIFNLIVCTRVGIHYYSDSVIFSTVNSVVYIGVVGRMAIRPHVLPELFNGEKDFLEWVDHFGDVAAINGWDEDAKLAWLKVRLTDRAQTAFKRIPQSTKEKFGDAVKALKERFEPTSKRELYTAEFQVRRKERKQDWTDFAQDLRMLADKAFPDLQMEARDRLSLNRFLDQITDPQINFAVKQRRPKTLDEAVAATLGMESYRTSAPISCSLHPTRFDI